MIRCRKRNLPIILTALVMVVSILSTITYNSLFSKINTYLLVAVSMFVTLRLFKFYKQPKSFLSVIVLIFAWWCFVATAIINSPNIYIWSQVVLWPELLMLVEIENNSGSFFENSKPMLRNIGNIMIGFSILIAVLSRFLGLSLRTNYIYQTYNLICFLPIIYVIEQNNSKRIRNITIITLLLNVIFAKRGGFVALILGVAAFYGTEVLINKLSHKNILRAIKYVVVALLLAVSALYIAEKMNLKILQRMQDMSMDTGSSGRDSIWNTLLTIYLSGSPKQKLFGFGFNGTYSVQLIGDGFGGRRGTAAHNDYIGVLFNYGYIALALLILIAIVLIVYLIKMVKNRYYLAPAFAMSLAIFAVFSWVSICAVSSEISCWLAIFWGCSISEYHKFRVKGDLRNV